MMNEKAKSLGTSDTFFVTPNGLDSGNHHSTARDMGIIASYAIKNNDFVKITNTESYSFSSNYRQYKVDNKNRLLKTYEGANGMKTGFTNKAGQCFVGAAKRGNMQLITVVLASGWGSNGKEQKWIDTKNLLNYGFANFKYYEVIKKGSKAGILNVTKSKTTTIGLIFENGLTIPLSEDEKNNIKINAHYEKTAIPPIEKDTNVGYAEVFINDKLEGKINLLTEGEAVRHDLKTKMENVFDYWLTFTSNKKIHITFPEFE